MIDLNVNVFVKRISQEVVVVTLSLLLATYFIVQKGVKGKYLSKQRLLKKETSHLEVANEVLLLQKRIPELEQSLYDKADVGFFISYLDRLIRDNGGNPMSVVPGDELMEYNIQKNTFLVNFRSDLTSLLKTLNAFYAADKMNHIAYLKVLHADVPIDSQDKVTNPLLDIKMTVIFFSRREDKTSKKKVKLASSAEESVDPKAKVVVKKKKAAQATPQEASS